jgi:hypothetical protein
MKSGIQFTYSTVQGYAPVFVNGAHGGVTPRGEIVIHFYHERPPLPDSITHELTPAGTIGPVVAQEPSITSPVMVRAIEAGVILTPENARNLHAWLGEQIREMESMEKAREAFAADLQGDRGKAH